MIRTHLAAWGLVLMLAGLLPATETENFGMQILPAPGAVTIDGKFNDWDLSGGIFTCGDVETQRDERSLWFHAMYDRENLYFLARWTDHTPMSHPGSTVGDFGWIGDCLQVRIVTAADTPRQQLCNLNCWKGRDGRDVVEQDIPGKTKNSPKGVDLKPQGARQAFEKYADGKGYVQEISIPWRLLSSDGALPKAGDRLVMTIEANFLIGADGRLSIKDIFKPGVTIDRVFTFQGPRCWGEATLEPQGKLSLRPVRLSDSRELKVSLRDGLPVVDWTSLTKSRESPSVKTIAFDMPEDGYVSMHIQGSDGQIVRQLLTCEQRSKGKQEVTWDGLATFFAKQPGQAVPPGNYTWSAIFHRGIGLRLRGWASNSGSAPWDSSPESNWGGDMGPPSDAATDGEKVYLAWFGAEAGKAIVALDREGTVRWRHKRGGIGGAAFVAVDGGIVYAVDSGFIYCLDAKTGGYLAWAGGNTSDVKISDLWRSQGKMPDTVSGLDVLHGKAYLSAGPANTLTMVDVRSGAAVRSWPIEMPGSVKAASDHLVYIVSGGKAVIALDPETGHSQPVVTGLTNASGLALDAQGNLYVGLRDPDNQVKVFSTDGKLLRAIGKQGGRPTLGKWVPDGMLAVSGMAVDRSGKLWVAESLFTPQRFSVWDAATGKLAREYFGPTHYGASGGAIFPKDPHVMVGEGCEWRIDPETGRATCKGVFAQTVHGFARFAQGSNGRDYLMVNASSFLGPSSGLQGIQIYERLGEGQYQLRGSVLGTGEGGNKTEFWADANGDGKVQPVEVQTLDKQIRFCGYTGWSLYSGTDLALYLGTCKNNQLDGGAIFRPTSFTSCGAPVYDLKNAEKTAGPGVPSTDGKYLLRLEAFPSVAWGQSLVCDDLAHGKRLWSYPAPYFGVHGSHEAPGPEMGMIRGAFDAVGSAKLPEPAGYIWAINTNVSEWHLLTQSGFYLTRLFQPDPLKVVFPAKAAPGAVLDNIPPGLGGEDFGGSLVQATDGKVYLQAGKVGLWNVEVVGLETIRPLGSGILQLSADDARTASELREQLLQQSQGRLRYAIHKRTPKFTGKIADDFNLPPADVVQYKKQETAAIISAAAWDEQNLYLAWDVADETPWLNGADAPEFMYARGDTVDFQIGVNPHASAQRNEAEMGDCRLSIGNFKDQPTAVLYRRLAAEKHAKTFSSGVVKEYPMESVLVVQDAKIRVAKRPGGYTVEAAIPLAALKLAPQAGLELIGDFGVTHGNAAGNRTALRTYWSNRHTGIVDDEVFELMMEPKNWGQLTFSE